MQYHLTDDQLQIRDVITAFLADRYDPHARDTILKAPGSWSPDIWSSLASELGVLGLSLPEDCGGMGGGPVDNLLVMDAFGEALVVEPYLETCVLGASLLRAAQGEPAQLLLAGIAEGSVRCAMAFEEPGARFSPLRAAVRASRSGDGFVLDGRKTMVIGAPAATHLLVTAALENETGVALFVVPSDNAALASRVGRTIDGKGVAEIEFTSCVVDGSALLIGPDAGGTAVEEALDAGAAALCAEAAGIMRRLIRDTVGYLEQRRQFGTALIDFQVLQHRLADMQVRYEQVQALAYFAAGVLTKPAETRSAAISAAKAFVGTAIRSVAQDAVQLHGAMGITEELAIGHLFKRATVLENEFGSVDYHTDRVLRVGLPEESLA